MDLKTFFEQNPKVALGFSGGVDSSYLLYAGLRYGAEVKAYFVKAAFQPEFELEDALQLAKDLKTEITVMHLDVLKEEAVTANPENRCYHCKQRIFGALKAQAEKDGMPLLIDGTNASDDAADRPGMKALQEMSVRSPLRECGITKPQVRELSKAAGLFTWDKPAYACLATRIPTGMQITQELLTRVEQAEGTLFQMGFTDFRVRVTPHGAKLQLPVSQFPKAIEQRQQVLEGLTPWFSEVLLDLKGR